ncbi:MAG TPA: hypothetical protein VGR00_09550, partial [Thermoanaerobaculia bacterium]|nr:hypothetical protein [Thermoanaerobaculia bacterium]
MSRCLAAAVVALSSFVVAPVEAGDAGAAVTSLAANGDVVWAATEGAGLRLSTDGGATFAPVPEVVCPRATVRDVAVGGARVAAACSDFETAFLLTGGSWTRRGSTLAASDVYAHPKDAGVGRPLLHFDPIDERAPTRLTGYAHCDYEGCEIYATVEAGAFVVSQRYTGFPEYPGSTPRLLAPSSARSPFVVSTTRGDGADGAAATGVRRGLARNDLPRLVFTYGTRPETSGDEGVGSIPDAIVTLRRAPSRSSRLVAAGTRGLWITEDEGASWLLAKGTTGPISDVVIAPDDACRFVVARGRDIVESTDGGETFRDVAGEEPSDVTSLAFDGSSPARLFVARADGHVELVKLARPLASAAGTPLLLTARYEPADGSVTLSAAIRSDEAATYRIERRDFGSGDWSRLSNLVVDARLSSASYRDPFPPPDRPLGYRVVASPPNGVEVASAEIFAVAPTTEPI